jgi:hypothetical protein
MSRRNSVSRAAWVLSLVVGLSRPLFSQTSPQGPEAGRELAEELRSTRPAEDVKWSGIVKILGREPKVPPLKISCQTILGETNWSVIYQVDGTESTGAEKLTVIFSTNAPTQYLYARATSPGATPGEPQTLTDAQADIPLAGSDFWLSDLGFEFYHWTNQVQHAGEMKHSRPCFVLESSNPHPNPNGYLRVVTWVEKESGQPIHAEAYGANNKLLKEFELGSVVKVNGHDEVKDMKMFNRKTDSRTYLDFDVPGK